MSQPRVTIDMDDPQETWDALYARIRDGEEPKPKTDSPDGRGVQIGKRIPAKGTE